VTASSQNQAVPAKATRRLALAGLALLLGAISAFLLLRPPAPRPAQPALTVLRTNLVLVAGRLCLVGQTNAFTGLMVDYASQGALRSRSALSNGLLHGLSEGWHTNGHLQVAEHFREGVSHGLRTKWHPNGVKLSQGMIVDGKFHGTFRRWSETGSLAEQAEMDHGEAQGIALTYYPSGFLKSRRSLQRGRVVDQQLWEDGQTKGPVGGDVIAVPGPGETDDSR
jgi:antitoxin component YwqK of YwqJK toxin-antitoxin module